MSEKFKLPVIDIIYEVAHKTKKEPIWVHIIKYNDAWIALLLGLTK